MRYDILQYRFPSSHNTLIEQKGMTFDHDFGNSFTLFSSLLTKEGRRKGEWLAKIMIKSHAFLLDPTHSIYHNSNAYFYLAPGYHKQSLIQIIFYVKAFEDCLSQIK